MAPQVRRRAGPIERRANTGSVRSAGSYAVRCGVERDVSKTTAIEFREQRAEPIRVLVQDGDRLHGWDEKIVGAGEPVT